MGLIDVLNGMQNATLRRVPAYRPEEILSTSGQPAAAAGWAICSEADWAVYLPAVPPGALSVAA